MVKIGLPLTLAVIQGFLVGVGSETYVIPIESVRLCVELDKTHEDGAHGGMMNLRGEALPFVRLGRLFGYDSGAGGRESMVVVEHAGVKLGIVVSSLLGEQATVIKSLGRLLKRVPGVSGSAILGSGRVALILDVPALLREATGAAGAWSAVGGSVEVAPAAGKRPSAA